jgi:type IV pilus assembly protein PilO
MNLEFLKKPIVILSLVNIAVVALLFLINMIIFQPMHAENAKLENTLNLERLALDKIKSDATNSGQSNAAKMKNLYAKVPSKQMLGKFLLSLEKAEVISNSLILNMDISESALEEEEGIKRITVSLSVTSPNFNAMETFLSSIEENKRITKIDSLTFTGVSEISNATATSEQVAYAVTVSTFYLTKYGDVVESIPAVALQNTSMKKNPFFTNVFSGDAASIHAVINRHIAALNEDNSELLQETIQKPTEGDVISTLSQSFFNENNHFELTELTIESLIEGEAIVHFVQKVTDNRYTTIKSGHLLEGDYRLRKINNKWRITDLYIENEVALKS